MKLRAGLLYSSQALDARASANCAVWEGLVCGVEALPPREFLESFFRPQLLPHSQQWVLCLISVSSSWQKFMEKG